MHNEREQINFQTSENILKLKHHIHLCDSDLMKYDAKGIVSEDFSQPRITSPIEIHPSETRQRFEIGENLHPHLPNPCNQCGALWKNAGRISFEYTFTQSVSLSFISQTLLGGFQSRRFQIVQNVTTRDRVTEMGVTEAM